MNNVYNNPVIDNFELKNINFKPPQIINNQLQIKIQYVKQPLILKTPLCIVTYIPEIDKFKKQCKIKIFTTDYLYNKNTQKFFKNLKEINGIVKKEIKKHPFYHTNLKPFNYFFVNTQKNNILLQPNLQLYNGKPSLGIYDSFNTSKEYNYITKDSECYGLILLKNIWINNNFYGINCELLQIKIFHPIYNLPYCFIEDNHSNHITLNYTVTEIKYKNHPKFTKFFKMKKLGVNIHAIQNQMKLESLNPNIINTPDKIYEEPKGKGKGKGKGKIPPPPPPSISSSSDSKVKIYNLTEVLKDLNNVKLKKTEVQNTQNIKIDSLFTPSLNQILSGRNNLKKII